MDVVAKSNRTYLSGLVTALIALITITIQFSPREQPLLIPVVIALICFSSFCIIVITLHLLSINPRLHVLVAIHVILGVMLGLFSLHQLRISDILLIAGLAVLLRLYSKR